MATLRRLLAGFASTSLALFFGVACGDVQTIHQTGSATGTSSSGTGGSAQSGSFAIAVLQTDLPVAYDRGHATYPDPDTLFIALGDGPADCITPEAARDCKDWNVELEIPPALQKVGKIPLSALPFVAVSDPQPGVKDPSQCLRGAGAVTSGTLELLSIDAHSVKLRLSGATTKAGFDPNGDYEALRCFQGQKKAPVAGACSRPDACKSDLDCTVSGCQNERCVGLAGPAPACDAQACSAIPAGIPSCGCVDGACGWWTWQTP